METGAPSCSKDTRFLREEKSETVGHGRDRQDLPGRHECETPGAAAFFVTEHLARQLQTRALIRHGALHEMGASLLWTEQLRCYRTHLRVQMPTSSRAENSSSSLHCRCAISRITHSEAPWSNGFGYASSSHRCNIEPRTGILSRLSVVPPSACSFHPAPSLFATLPDSRSHASASSSCQASHCRAEFIAN